MNAIEYQQFSEFRDIVETLVAPEDIAENMEGYFRDQVAGALADIQTFIPWFRDFNVDFFTKADTTEFCNVSVVQGPVGKVTQLFAYRPFVDCKRIYYKRVSISQMDCWMERQRCLCPASDPPEDSIYLSPYCNYVIDGEDACGQPYLTGDEDDARFMCLDDDSRVFAVAPDNKILAAPRFPCGYYLVVQWQGIKRNWVDTDLVPVDQQLRGAVTAYVEWRMALKERIFDAARANEILYHNALADLKYRYRDEMDPDLKRDCTSAIAQSLPAFLPAYMTPIHGP